MVFCCSKKGIQLSVEFIKSIREFDISSKDFAENIVILWNEYENQTKEIRKLIDDIFYDIFKK